MRNGACEISQLAGSARGFELASKEAVDFAKDCGIEGRLKMELNRRQFTAGFMATLLMSFANCRRPADYLEKLRAILRALESGLGQLGGMTGIPAGVIAQVAAYLSAVAKFVDDTAHLLESTAMEWAGKVQQILDWAKAIVPPEVQGQAQVAAVIRTVQASIDTFLRFFQPTPPAPTLSDSDKALIQTIEAEAAKDEQAVKQWAARAR